MKKLATGLMLIVALLLLSCAPRAAPTPAPTIPQAPAPTPVVAAPTPVKISPEEAEWQKVIEAAKKEGKLTVYSMGFIGEPATQIIKAFKARYNIDMEIIAGRGAEFTERLKTERRTGSRVADVVETGATWLMTMRDSDLLEAIPNLPVFRNKGDFIRDPVGDKVGYVLVYIVQIRTPMVNTKLVKPEEEPKSWQDMLNPKWKGKLLAYNPLVSGGMYNTFIPLLNAKAITLEFLRALGKQDLIMTRGDQEIVEKLSRGEFPIALAATDSFAATFAKEGAPIKAIPMAEGVVILLGSTIAQAKDPPHPNAAKLFLNWLFSPEGQTAFHKFNGSRPLRKDLPDFTPPALILPPTTKFISETVPDTEEESKKFIDKWFIELWK